MEERFLSKSDDVSQPEASEEMEEKASGETLRSESKESDTGEGKPSEVEKTPEPLEDGKELTSPEGKIEEGVTPEAPPIEEIEEVVEIKEEVVVALLEEGSTIKDPSTNITYQVKRALQFEQKLIPYNIYEVWKVPEEGTEDISSVSLWLWEAVNPSLSEALKREGEVLSSVELPMFPKLYSRFENGGRFYLLTEALSGEFLADIIDSLSLPQFLTIISQVSFAIANLHKAGWLHLGITPEAILKGKPAKVLNFRWAMPIGGKVTRPFYLSGYSPPELLHTDEALDERADIYSLGALIYRFLYKHPIPESGVEFPGADIFLPGVPQILYRCLTTKEERYPNMWALHRALLQLARWYLPSLRYTVVGGTTVGLDLERSNNQDAYGYLEGVKETNAGPSRWLITCVADGMGGMEAGELASQMAVDSVLAQASSLARGRMPSGEEQNRLLREWVNKANEEICDALQKMQVRGGTTLLLCFIIDKRLALAHIGDCRLYLLRGGQLTLLTRDHSLAAALAMQENNYDPDALRHHPDRSHLTRSLGDRLPLPTYFIDSLETTTGKSTLELENGDILILCTDGIWEPISGEEIVQIIQQNNSDLQEASYKILELVLQRGAPDNATILLIKVEEIPPPGLNKGETGGDSSC